MHDPGHELSGGMLGRSGVTGHRGIKGRKKWDNCNSIINKIYLRKKKKRVVQAWPGEGA